MNGNVSAHQGEIDRFYELLDRRVCVISRIYGRIPTPGDLPTARDSWRTRGVYFCFERGENRTASAAQRVVRVGSHSGDHSTIESRIVGEHFPEWGRSVFRGHIGTALIRSGVFDSALSQADRDDRARGWRAPVKGHKAHTSPKHLHRTLHPLHPIVTQVIGDMTVVWVEIADRRLELEKQCIRLLSNYLRHDHPIDPPSSTWLGRHALDEKVRRSGLWNVMHVGRLHTPGFLENFQQYF